MCSAHMQSLKTSIEDIYSGQDIDFSILESVSASFVCATIDID